ncbi:MAG TPA: invasion associated locus B family protein [Stellaceae bacterium]|nr:invasion associated locus B family protein [Stellaceae bacterium]
MQRWASSLAGAVGLLVLAPPLSGFAAEKPPSAAEAAAPQEIGGAKGWTAYSYAEKKGKVCYLLGRPAKSEPASRGRIDAMVTERPHDKQFNVVSFDAGVPFKEGSDVALDIDGHGFSLFSDKESAWARDAATDKAVTEALAKGRRAVLKGTTSRGATLTQSYALDGFAEALAAIDKACGVKR